MNYVCATIEVLKEGEGVVSLTAIQNFLDEHCKEAVELDGLPVYCVLTYDRRDAPFRVFSPHHIALSLWEVKGLTQYTGMALTQHLTLYLNLALLQRKALFANPLLKQDDFNHPKTEPCLFQRPDTIEEYARQLEEPTVCEPCRAFYRSLGCEGELEQFTHYRSILMKSVE
ncbi:MAG: hypothetical protein VCD00_00425 [Candidatus Hydrogenedentota bacterium]